MLQSETISGTIQLIDNKVKLIISKDNFEAFKGKFKGTSDEEFYVCFKYNSKQYKGYWKSKDPENNNVVIYICSIDNGNKKLHGHNMKNVFNAQDRKKRHYSRACSHKTN